jgi:hypothetical protein
MKANTLRRAFCFGMPKCGTTSLAELLAHHPAISLHNQKEPADFLRGPRDPSDRSGYRVEDRTEWLLDFTTAYGLSHHRQNFLDNLRASGLDPKMQRYFLCLRPTRDLARSYLKHILLRRHSASLDKLDDITSEILSACDFVGAVRALEDNGCASSAYVVIFDELLTPEGQSRTFESITSWLSLHSSEPPQLVWANSLSSHTRYPGIIEGIAASLRETRMVRDMPPTLRRMFSRALSHPAEGAHLTSDVERELLARVQSSDKAQASDQFLSTIRSGPLASLSPPQSVVEASI